MRDRFPQPRGAESFAAKVAHDPHDRHTREAREFVENPKAAEARLRDEVRGCIAEWLRRSRASTLPRWVRSGMLLTRLFGVETAAAQEAVEPGEGVLAMTQTERRELEAYLHEGNGGILVRYGDAGSMERIDASALESGKAIVFEKHVTDLNFFQYLPASAMQDTYRQGSGWTVAPDNELAAVQYVDGGGNEVTVFRSRDEATGMCEQYITVEPAIAFADPGREPELRQMDIDLTSFGGTHIHTALWYRELPSIGAVHGSPVYASGVEAGEVETIVAQYGDAMGKGLENVGELFGFHNPVRVIVVEQDAPNAYYTGFGTIAYAQGFFAMADGSQAPDLVVEETTEHEALHYYDVLFGISESLAMQRVFASGTPEALQELNEHMFSELGFGGHAQDNEKEFVATILNTVDVSGWERAVARLSPEARALLHDGLTAARNQIANHEIVQRLSVEPPPILALLALRIEALASIDASAEE